MSRPGAPADSVRSLAITPAAATLGGGLPGPFPLFPADNWWNLDITNAPIDSNSAAFITFINNGGNRSLHPDFGGEESPGSTAIYGFPYIVVDSTQAKKTVQFGDGTPEESDGVDHNTNTSFPFYPIPDEAITQVHWVEGGSPGNVDERNSSDRHILIVDKDNKLLYELYNVFHDGSTWRAYSGAFFDMKTNNRRPDGWTSADAAGLAILPGLVRYDEVYGTAEINHAFRVTLRASNGYVYPASHAAGTNSLALPMGARLRLKASKDISGYDPAIQKIFRAMKKYGLIMADNGSDMYISGTFNTLWNNGILNPAFNSLHASDFEVVQRGYNPVQAATLSIGDVSVLEGDAGTTNASFTATLSVESAQTVTVSAVTSNGTAIAPGDYAATGPQTLTFAPSVTTQTFTVLVNGDIQAEGDETLTVTLSNPTNATIADGTGVGTILNDDGATVWDAVASEGYVSPGVMKFLVSRAATATGPGTVDYVTTGGTATEPSDYLPASGTLTFANGERRKFIEVTINGDKVEEPNETFTLTLFNPVGFTLARSVATGTILNDDEATLRVTDAKSWDSTWLPAGRFGEGTGAGTSYLSFNIWTSKILYDRDIYVDYTTLNGTATSGSDYNAASGTAMIARGTAVQQVIVPVVRDSNQESDETMIFRLSNAINASIHKSDGLGTVVADDGLVVSIGDKSLTEGNAGTSPMLFTATLNQASAAPVTVNWSTVEGSAIAPDDYVTANGQITFGVSETTKTITVQVVGDAVSEPYETFSVVLSSPGGGAVLGDAEGTGTIVNTDGISDRFRLMFHNLADNHLYRWHFKKELVGSPSLETFNWVTPWGPDPAWHIGAIADFDRDGNLDYLWHNYTTGQILFWYIDGDNLKGFKFGNYTMASPWRAATTMDANGDGELDVVYYNSVTDALKVVLCDNGNRITDYDVPHPATNSPSGAATASDVNGDGTDDLILYNSTTGLIQAWQLSGANVTGTLIYPDMQVTPGQFRLVSARADFNADGKPDFLWHNTTTGFFMTWSMDGTTRLGIGAFASPFDRTDPTWRLVGAATLWP